MRARVKDDLPAPVLPKFFLFIFFFNKKLIKLKAIKYLIIVNLPTIPIFSFGNI